MERMNVETITHFTGQPRRLWVKDDDAPFNTGSTSEDRSYTFNVTSSAEPLKVTLAWTDFPSTPAASVNLVNDLDLIVSGPGGTYLGSVFSGGVSITGGSADQGKTIQSSVARHT